MRDISRLETVRQEIVSLIPDDTRSCLSPLNFVLGVVFCFFGDSKTASIEGIRRFCIASFGVNITRASFWGRIARKRLNTILIQLICHFMTTVALRINSITEGILTQLGVSGILLIDSTSISLWDGAKDLYPGTRTTAGIKWHGCFNLFTGSLFWFEITATSRNDRKCFPEIKLLKGKLIIFDLGYWDYGLLTAISNIGGFFLTRIKANAKVVIEGVSGKLSQKYIGKCLNQCDFKIKRDDVLEFACSFVHDSKFETFRVIAFWNPIKKQYHWYITNLNVTADVIYPLYRLRWQIELIFKSCKNSMNMNAITSNSSMIIENLVLASILAHILSMIVLDEGKQFLNDDQMWAISFQRISKVINAISNDLVLFFSDNSDQERIMRTIKLFSNELYDPNYKTRQTSLARLKAELGMI